MLRSLLIAVLAALLVGAAVTDKVEAQSWTCDWSFATSGLPSGWTLVYGTLTSDGIQVAYYDANWYNAETTGPAGTTVTNITITYKTTQNLTNIYTWADGLVSQVSSSRNNTTWTTSGSGSKSSPTISLGKGVPLSPPIGLYLVSANMTGTGTNPCTPTPTPTLTPSNTPVPTATNTPLPTATPVAYPTDAPFIGAQGDSYWGNTYNMTYGLQGWSLISGTLGGGRVVSADVGGTQRLEMEYPLGNVKVTDVFANYEASCAHTFEVKDGNTVFEAGSVGSGMQALVWQGEHVMSNGSLKISLVGGSGCGVSAFQLYEITIMGYGTNPTNLQATAIAFEAGNLYSGLSDVNTLLESLPASINSGVPDETGRTLFGYAKWLISPSSADELAGPFAPIVSHTGIFVSLTFALVLVYAIVWAVVWIFRFVVWLFRIILQIIQVVVSVIGSIFKFFF